MLTNCEICGQPFGRNPAQIKRNYRQFCSLECYNRSRYVLVAFVCTQCGKGFMRRRHRANADAAKSKSGNYFCSHSCAAIWNNAHKTTGTRRSKLEVWLEEQLRIRYPDLEILFNAREAINAELDIHFPSLDLAFELNGIYHYEPIHGETKLISIQTNDHRKFAACAEKGIALCVIDVSTMTYFKPTKGQKFLDIIVELVDTKLA